MSDYIKAVIADDDAIIINGMKKFINWNEYGYAIVGAVDNGKALIELCKTQDVDVIISDIEMPKANGLEAIKTILQEKKNMKVILISGYEKFEYAKEAISYGVFYYLLKPINPVELVSVLKRLKNEFYSNTEELANMHISSNDVCKTIEEVKNLIDSNQDKDISLEYIQKKYFISAAYFSKMFKEVTGHNFTKYRQQQKMTYARHLVENTHYKFYEIAEKLQYDDERYFSRVYKKYYGKTPRECRERL